MQLLDYGKNMVQCEPYFRDRHTAAVKTIMMQCALVT